MQINSYLFFSGDCEKAFDFYRKVFKKDFAEVNRYAEMPNNDELTAEQKERIMHISLPLTEHFTLMGSDMIQPEFELIAGNASSISINPESATTSEEEVRRIFDALSEGGKVDMPLEKTFWGALFGSCTDQFGHSWLMNYTL